MAPATRNASRFKTIRLTIFFYLLVITGFIVLVNACKHVDSVKPSMTTAEAIDAIKPAIDDEANETELLTVAHLIRSEDGNTYQVMFYERAQVFILDAKKDRPIILQLQSAFSSKQPVRVTTSPYPGRILEVTDPSSIQVMAYNTVMKRDVSSAAAVAITYSASNPDIDKPQNIPLPSTAAGLTTIIPDMVTAKMMFNYFAQQSCNLPGPYGIDQCIPFQFVGDGCFARAHKMGQIIMNKYHYSLLKVFSFGTLSVRANKWGGCCVGWWYHVAPLVQVKTTAGIRSYVMDPGMFDQPVLLSDWLSAQKNKGCNPAASVTSYSIQPASTYTPGTTDSTYALTNAKLNEYSHNITCH